MLALNDLAARRIRLIVRASFSALIVAAILVPYLALSWQRERSYASYLNLLDTRRQQIVDKLLHPAGQLVLFNPTRFDRPPTPLHSVVAPYGAIQADDPRKVKDLVDTIGCPVRYREGATACLAVGKDDERALRRIYLSGSFISTTLVPHTFLESVVRSHPGPAVLKLQDAHRLRIDLSVGTRVFKWVLPVQVRIDPRTKQPLDGLTMTAYRLNDNGTPDVSKPSFTGAWLVQGGCTPPESDLSTCKRETVFSVAIPRLAWADADADGALSTVPAKAQDVTAHLTAYGPAAQGKSAVLMDTDDASARLPFVRSDLMSYLLPDEQLTVRRLRAGDAAEPILKLEVFGDQSGQTSQWGRRILDLLPADVSSSKGLDGPPKLLSIRDVAFEVVHKGNPQSVDSALAEGAARMVVYAMLMLLAISAAWITIEVGIVSRVLTLTRRTAEVSRAARADGDLGRFDFSDLRGQDELGILAAGVDDLLRKISDDLQRAQIRMDHEKDMLRAIGHEIRSPLQSLSALHAKEVDPSRRYIRRMLQAVQALYGSASPTDGVESVAIQDEVVDVAQFLQSVAENAPDAGIDGVVFEGVQEPTLVRADAAALEDAITHILTNATRYRPPGTAITVGLKVIEDTAIATIHNHGPHVPEDMIGRIFEYGVSDQPDGGALGNRGQGLFVAKTYLAKMGGSITVQNKADGVQFEIRLPVVQQKVAPESLPSESRVTRWLRA